MPRVEKEVTYQGTNVVCFNMFVKLASSDDKRTIIKIGSSQVDTVRLPSIFSRRISSTNKGWWTMQIASDKGPSRLPRSSYNVATLQINRVRWLVSIDWSLE